MLFRSVVKIVRGEISINIPGGREKLYPYDKIIIAGTDKQVKSFSELLDERKRISDTLKSENKDVKSEHWGRSYS